MFPAVLRSFFASFLSVHEEAEVGSEEGGAGAICTLSGAGSFLHQKVAHSKFLQPFFLYHSLRGGGLWVFFCET